MDQEKKDYESAGEDEGTTPFRRHEAAHARALLFVEIVDTHYVRKGLTDERTSERYRNE